jgi:putative toxin-antitoxin system antitoxin component (TIGR02293 family)
MSSVKLQASRKRRPGKKAVARAVRAKRAGTVTARREAAAETRGMVAYHSTTGVDEYVRQVARATPLELVEIERQGVLGSFIKDLSRRMEIPSSRIFTILGVPKATAEKKAAAGEKVVGRGGQAAIGMVKLLGIAHEIVARSTAAEAKAFDATRWLGQWIERPQPALGGRKPADLLDTPTGVELVARLLGSIESGAYQ